MLLNQASIVWKNFLCRSVVVSYQEFLEMFRKQQQHLVNSFMRIESSIDDDGSLVGIDTKIPGGKFDTSVREKMGL